MAELKPCPFCGETPALELFGDGFYDYARIRCCRVIFDWRGDKTGEQAIAAWNRRAQPENKPLTLDELIDALTRLQRDFSDLRNELCQVCGKYKKANKGS